ncbi:MAG TPA: HAMP domain-containing sensor histidine kinase [Actinomycetes bacterium]|jgi:signal transduction histidine kinase|nr:HAMP domain-containing sensor histidine kinase [Actinomycetes bacterium]
MRNQLRLLVAATMSAVLIAFLVPLGLLIRTIVADRVANTANRQVQTLTPLVATANRADLELSVQRASVDSGYPVSVFLPDGGTVLGTPVPRSAAVELAAAQGRSLTADTAGGREIVVAVQGLPGGTAVVRTFVSDAQLRAGVSRAWLVLALLGLALLLVGLLVADRLARSMSRPVEELAAVSRRLAAGELTARAGSTGPEEIRAVAAALNELGSRIRGLVTHERERVADLSHQLRTPLTALRLEAEALSDRAEAERVTTAVDALERTVTRAIEQARRPVAPDAAQSDAAAVVAQRVQFWSVLAEDQRRQCVTAVATGPLLVAVAADELAACVDALLGNVFAHTPEGAGFSVELTPAGPGGGAVLVVADEGPGFDLTDPTRRGASGAGSTGLGLDIVRRAAEASGGRLAVSAAPDGGARVVVELGAPLAGR